MSERTVTVEDEKGTEKLACEIAATLIPGMTVGLSGPIGAGKTTFVRYLAASLGLKTPVSSPTFVLCHEYTREDGVTLLHWDLYRVKSCPEELLEPPPDRSIAIIEWIEKFPEIALRADLSIRISAEGDRRRFKLNP